jgi:phosphatidyl-myo-inositol dimannoside synthase
MNIVFLTYGLTPHNTRLMPWRYILEIAKGIIHTGNDATIVTDGAHEGIEFPSDMPPVKAVQGSFTIDNQLYQACIDKVKPDVIYIPVARRSVFSRSTDCIKGINHFAYFPSPWYEAKRVLRVAGELSFHDAYVYALESLVPGKWLVKSMKKKKISGLVTVTEYTAQSLMRCGWPVTKVKALPPGIDLLQPRVNTSNIYGEWSKRIKDKQYLLFMGPPTAIRGVYFLLKAFDRAAGSLDDIELVCLLRQSSEAEVQRFKKAVMGLKHKERVVVIEDKLAENDVAAFTGASRAVALPFMIIPSEIPLTVIETMALGKPVIITETGGTSQFIGKAGIVVPQNDIGALARTIADIFLNEAAYLALCKEAKRIAKNQLQWQETAQALLDFTAGALTAKKS